MAGEDVAGAAAEVCAAGDPVAVSAFRGGHHAEIVAPHSSGHREQQRVAGIGNPGHTVLFLYDPYRCHRATPGVGSFHIRYEVAERIDKKHVFVGKILVGTHFHGLDHVGMCSDDHVHPEGFEVVGS